MAIDGAPETEGTEGRFSLGENLREQDDPTFYASLPPSAVEHYLDHVVLSSPGNGLVSSAVLEGLFDGPRGRRTVNRLATAIKENGVPDTTNARSDIKYVFDMGGRKIDMSLDRNGLVTLKPDEQLGGGEIVMHNGSDTRGPNKKEFGVIWIKGFMKGEGFPGREAAIARVESLLGTTLAKLPDPKI